MQRPTTKVREVEQLSLIPDRKIISRPVSLEHVRLLRSTKEALEYGCQLANVAPKEVYGQMECDKSTWSRICGGERDLYGRAINRFGKVVNNDAYLMFLNHEASFDLGTIRKIQTDSERRIADLESENRDLRRAMSLWVESQKASR